MIPEIDWFEIVQTLGIILTILFLAYQINRTRKMELLRFDYDLISSHREIWINLLPRPEFKRILDKKADIKKHPITPQEKQFVIFVTIHVEYCFNAKKLGIIKEEIGDREDIKDFYSKPIPNKVWKELKSIYPPEFVKYMDGILNKEN